MAFRSPSRRLTRRYSAHPLYQLLLLTVTLLAVGWSAWGRSRPQLAERAEPVYVAKFDTVRVSVPELPVAAGARLRDVRFIEIEFPVQQLPEGALKSVAPYADYTARTALPARVPVFAENLLPDGATVNPVLDRIPQGMRAMTIKVDATSSVEGWAGSGSVVDVLLVEKSRTTVIAEGVKILSAERRVQPVDGQGLPNVPSTVTILVTQEQCLAINTAVPLGRIAFALRSLGDESRWLTRSWTAEKLERGEMKPLRPARVTGTVRFERDGKAVTYSLAGGEWIPGGADYGTLIAAE